MQTKACRNKTKNNFSLLLTAIFVVLFILIMSTTVSAQTIMGDVNGDGRVDVKDVVLIQKHVLGKISLTAQQRDVADVNGDGLIDARDVTLVMQRSIGKITTFPLQVTKVDEIFKSVAYGTPQASIGLPSTVSATISNGAKRDISVQWETTSTPAYNPNVQGSYVFYGNLITLPSGITNPSAIKAKATVNISYMPGPQPGPYPPYVIPLSSVTISGTPVVGGALSVSSIAPAGATASYQWQSSPTGILNTFVNIPHYSGTYTIVSGDAGKYFRVVATGTGNYYGTVGSNVLGPVPGITGVTLGDTNVSPQGIEFVSGRFTSGSVIPANTAVMDDTLKVAGITVYINWKDGTTSFAATHVYDSNILAKTATVAIYRSGTAEGTVYSNAATALTAAINKVKDDAGYNDILKGTIASVINGDSAKINITDIPNTISASAANALKFDVISPSSSGFSVYYDGKNITAQVSEGETDARLHVNEVLAVATTAVTNGASASGSIVVNVDDGTLDVEVPVNVLQGDTASVVAGKIYTQLTANATITAKYNVSVSGVNVILTQKVGKADNIVVTLK